MALLTMTVSTYIITYNHAIYDRLAPWFSRFESGDERQDTVEAYEGHAVAIGFDEITEQALPLLEARYGQVVVIDRRTEHIAQLEAEGRYDHVFGDFRHREVRKASGLNKATFVLSSTVEADVNRALLDEVSEDAIVFVEADRISDAYELYERGATYVIMDTYLAAEKLVAHLERYVTDPEAFEREIQTDVERIRRKSRQLTDRDRRRFRLDMDPRGGGHDE